jgi:CHAT domain-containing protein
LGIAAVQFPPGLSLTKLVGSNRSLENLDSYFNSADNFVFDKASRNNFLNNFYRYKIIQLYAHASDSSDLGEPVIYFADSALYLSDLIHSSIPVTNLIVLSACESGLGKLYKGEGVFSFSRGFAAIGIPASITNLWEIDNESTYKLTELFYKYISKGMTKDVALQKAKIEFLTSAGKEGELPYFWASAILIGKTDKIDLKKGFNWKMAGLIGLGGLLVFLGYRKFLKRK